jgi:ABC-type Zn uptake system ZnuABC Zn-binding protein ZnuA
MIKLLVGLVASLVVVAVFSCGAVAAEEKKEEAKKTTVTGTVGVTKDDKGAVTGVKVGEQKLVVDEKAQEVAKLDGKKVEVVGTLAADGALKVESCKEVVEPKKGA